MSRTGLYLGIALCFAACSLMVHANDEEQLRTTRELAIMLAEEEDHHGSSIEFRRLAMSSGIEERAPYYWASAYETMRRPDHALANTLLDESENHDSSIENEILFLRAENAWEGQQLDEASFYYQTLLDSTACPAALRLWSARRMAAIELMQQQPDMALLLLQDDAASNDQGLIAIRRYAQEHDKKPMVGGLLGLIPGLGYVYSGEYANALRSMILNGLFIFGMVSTAEEEQWGAFSVISFFELTWYSGSIYGGIDAAHRYNKERLQSCIDDIHNDAAYHVQLRDLPLVSLHFTF
ncbi:MAG: hypothetical protein EOL87_08555 [Spartobacteria bacterium]|nr:hypothetical protein [Spartobacteria bacterium]